MDITFTSSAQRPFFFRMLLSFSCLVLLANLLAACTKNSALPTHAANTYDQYVQRSGVMSRFDAHNTGFNPYEHALSPQTVAHVQEQGSYQDDAIGSNIIVGNDIVYTTSGEVVSAFNGENGGRIWFYTFAPSSTLDIPSLAPVLAQDSVYVSSLNTLCALDAKSGKSSWCDHLTGSGIESELTYANGVLYGATASALLALDARTGALVWTAPLKGPRYGQILATDTMVYVTSYLQQGVLQALDVHSGKLRWTFEVPHDPELSSDPILTNGIIYLASPSALHAISAQTGKQIWEVPLEGVFGSVEPATAYGLLYLDTEASDGSMQFEAFDLKTGQVVWKYLLQGHQNSCNPMVADGVVYACTQDTASSIGGNSYYWIYALDASSGQQIRAFLNGSSSFAPGEVVVADSHIYISGEGLGFGGGGETLEVWG